MKKVTQTVLVDIGLIKYFKKLSSWMKVKYPAFFTNAVLKYQHYTNPLVFQMGKYYYVIGKIASLEAALANGAEEILVDVMYVTEDQAIEMFLAYQYEEGKEPLQLVETTRIVLDYIKTPQGKEWVQKNIPSNDNEERIATILGVSNNKAKQLIKLAKPANEKYCSPLVDKKNSISGQYNLCISDEKIQQQSSGGGNKASVKPIAPIAGRVETTKADDSDPDDFFVPNKGTAASTIPTPVATSKNFSNIDGYKEMIEKYRKVSPGPADSCFKQLVTLHLHDGKTLELNVYVQLEVDGSPISSVNQLEPLPNGNWTLPKHSVDFKLIVLPAVVNSIVDVTHFAENSESKNVA